MITTTTLLADATFFPQRIDFLRQSILFVRHTRDDYRCASFLDGRILGPQAQGAWASFGQVRAALGDARPMRPLHFIFHTGHVGSTLLSRLLEDAGATLALREPLTLRLLAEANDTSNLPESLVDPALLDILLQDQITLWSRGFDDTRTVIVKATSSAARLGSKLMRASPTARAVYLNLRLEPYLATLLAGENSIFDLRGHGPERMRRFCTFGGDAIKPLHAMSPGELAALAWVTETLTQARLAEEFGDRILSLDFDVLLADTSAELAHACAHFDIAASPEFLANAPESPTLRVYAKAQEAAYSPNLRAALLKQTRQTRADEIDKGLAWAREALIRTPLLSLAALG